MNPAELRDRYLALLQDSLLNELHVELEAQLLHVVLCIANHQPVTLAELELARRNEALLGALRAAKQSGDTLVLTGLGDDGRVAPRAELRNWTEFPHTMIGRLRLEHLRCCVESVIAEGVPGDLLEAGVWRGGACVMMSGVLQAHGIHDRTVWVADSFSGLRPPSASQDFDYDMSTERLPFLAVPEEEVRALFERYGLLDGRVRFLRGWFSDSLPGADVGALAVLRIDADYYESTRDVLQHLYPKVSTGGFVIIDDYQVLPPCRQAVDEFLAARDPGVAPLRIGDHAVYWRRG